MLQSETVLAASLPPAERGVSKDGVEPVALEVGDLAPLAFKTPLPKELAMPRPAGGGNTRADCPCCEDAALLPATTGAVVTAPRGASEGQDAMHCIWLAECRKRPVELLLLTSPVRRGASGTDPSEAGNLLVLPLLLCRLLCWSFDFCTTS